MFSTKLNGRKKLVHISVVVLKKGQSGWAVFVSSGLWYNSCWGFKVDNEISHGARGAATEWYFKKHIIVYNLK